MPFDRVAALQVTLLILAVPAQYFLSTYVLPSTHESRTRAILSLTKKATNIRDNYFTLDSWKAWCTDLLERIHRKESLMKKSVGDPMGESPALEVIKYRDPKGYFAADASPRSPRPSSVKFRVGQVIKHKRWGYRGIIIGWDPSAKAPEQWIQQMHPPDKPHWRHQPNYAILVDTRDRLAPQTTYVPQENIEILTNVKVMHPEVDDYFEIFDGAQYLPRPWLTTIYPHD